jgi:hypothetical protein
VWGCDELRTSLMVGDGSAAVFTDGRQPMFQSMRHANLRRAKSRRSGSNETLGTPLMFYFHD